LAPGAKRAALLAMDESGQTAAEYMGALLLVAALLAALASAGIATAIAGDIDCIVTRIGGGAGDCAPPPQQPDVRPWDSTDPVERATWGTYVSLGDSYSAGEGLGDYQPGRCDRSPGAYNSTVSAHFSFKGGTRTWACSGATIDDVFSPDDPTCGGGEGCQVNRVDAGTSLVTLSIGGNDAGFADDLRECYLARLRRRACSGAGPAIDAKIAAIGPKLQAAIRAIHARAPHARIVIVTYPRPFPAHPTGNGACVTFVCLTTADQVFLNGEAEKLDDAICAAAAGAECIDARDAFAGCELGQPDSCLQAPRIHGLSVDRGSFHPTRHGQQVLGDLVDGRIAKP
jgi:hypothetical protein